MKPKINSGLNSGLARITAGENMERRLAEQVRKKREIEGKK